MQKFDNRAIALYVISFIFLSLANTIPFLAFLSFLFLAPIIALRQQFIEGQLKKKLRYIAVIPVITFISYLISLLIMGQDLDIFSLLIYSIAIVIPFVILEVTEHYAPNKWGALMLVVYWVGVEYLCLKIAPGTSEFFLSNLLPDSWMGWNEKTGYLGGTTFVVLGNVLFYYSLLRSDNLLIFRIRWISLAITLLIIATIIWYGYSFESSSYITKLDMLSAYQTSSMVVNSTSYTENGEFIGRLALWVTVMVVLYSVVKGKLNRK